MIILELNKKSELLGADAKKAIPSNIEIDYNDSGDIATVIKNMLDRGSEYLKYLPPIYPFWTTYKSTQAIADKLESDPVLKEKTKNVISNMLNAGENVVNTLWSPVKGVSTLLEWLPYIVIGGLGIAAVYVVKSNKL